MTDASTDAPTSKGTVIALTSARTRRLDPAPAAPAPLITEHVSFDRRELNALLNLYGRRVAEGEWRDYAISFLKDRAVFSIFRRTSEAPLYRIEKQPRLARKQGAWAVVTTTGLILKRGNDLARVLAVLDKPTLTAL